jgi:RimJ/RimL family protein N-acetyltransferase
MVTDGVITLADAREDQLELFQAMELDPDTEPFIIAESVDQHRRRFRRDDVVYKAVLDGGGYVVGFIILILDPDQRSVEFGRIVIARKGKSYGSRAVALVEQVCRRELDRRRVWLDVFEFNARARHVYESNGYRPFADAEYGGRPLKLYHKEL